jgi:hypothetical protein
MGPPTWKGFRGSAADTRRQLNVSVLARINSRLFNAPLDMVVETHIKQRMPLLAASQFVCTRIIIGELLNAREWVLLERHLRRPFYRAFRALDGAYALFLDDLFDNTTNYFAQQRDRQHVDLAKKLVERFKAMFPSLKPGEEYDVVDRFADALRLRDIYTWIPVTSPAAMKGRNARQIVNHTGAKKEALIPKTSLDGVVNNAYPDLPPTSAGQTSASLLETPLPRAAKASVAKPKKENAPKRA